MTIFVVRADEAPRVRVTRDSLLLLFSGPLHAAAAGRPRGPAGRGQGLRRRCQSLDAGAPGAQPIQLLPNQAVFSSDWCNLASLYNYSP
eukprot:scaffold55156_cov31-Prasinocladus_malaysianus.AAC.1